MKLVAILCILLILVATGAADFALSIAQINGYLRMAGFVLVTGVALACVGFAVHLGFRDDKTLRRNRSDTL